MNNDTVFEASVLEYDRYEPPVGPRSCHSHSQVPRMVTETVNRHLLHKSSSVLLVVLGLTGTFKYVFLNTHRADIPCWGRILDLTKDTNDQMVV